MRNVFKLVIFLGSALIGPAAYSEVVQNYHSVFIPVYPKGENTLYLAIRTYENEANQTRFLVVNSQTLETDVKAADQLDYRDPTLNNNGYVNDSQVRATRYMRTLDTYTRPPYVSANQGLKRAEQPAIGSAHLTIDLCPSVRPYERHFFDSLAALPAPGPTPVAVSISGLWLLGHPQAFDYLLQQKRENKLAITWINHSFSHAYYPDLPIEENFLAIPGTDVINEWLDVERLLLMNGETPSVFVRLPGLISNRDIIEQTRRLGLIPVGSESWLAKNEPIKDGSIVLVHGNGNEPKGIELAMPELDRWHWRPLKEAIAP